MEDIIIQMNKVDRLNLIYWLSSYKALVKEGKDWDIFHGAVKLLSVKIAEGSPDAQDCIFIIDECTFCNLVGALHRIRKRVTDDSWNTTMSILLPPRKDSYGKESP